MTVNENAGDFYRQELDMSNTSRNNSEEKILKNAVLRLNGHILGFVMGVIGALGIFFATNWLVLKGGDVVGPHLGLLGNFFIGYDVTFVGSLIGAAYAFILGYISGLIIGWIYNAVVFLKNK